MEGSVIENVSILYPTPNYQSLLPSNYVSNVFNRNRNTVHSAFTLSGKHAWTNGAFGHVWLPRISKIEIRKVRDETSTNYRLCTRVIADVYGGRRSAIYNIRKEDHGEQFACSAINQSMNTTDYDIDGNESALNGDQRLFIYIVRTLGKEHATYANDGEDGCSVSHYSIGWIAGHLIIILGFITAPFGLFIWIRRDDWREWCALVLGRLGAPLVLLGLTMLGY
jgi:hypothetical protein